MSDTWLLAALPKTNKQKKKKKKQRKSKHYGAAQKKWVAFWLCVGAGY